jgi:hypothetical protein
MPNKGKKITLFLMDGEPDGRKELTLSSWNAAGFIFPRNKLKEFTADAYSQKPGVYFLFGRESEDSSVTSAYIGHADNIADRLSEHNRDKAKDFWYQTAVFVSNTDTITRAHAKYIESQCIRLAMVAKHYGYILKNGNEPVPANLPRADIPETEEFVTNINLLLTTAGYPLLQKVESGAEIDSENPLFIFKNDKIGTRGTASMTNEGFIMYKDSTIASVYTSTGATAVRGQKIIEQLLEEDVLVKEGELYRLVQDYRFASPSAAADLVCGYSANGWDVWKTSEGKTLDELYRHQ